MMLGEHPITRALVSVIMHCREPMVLTDPNVADHPMVAVNPAFTALTGYPIEQTIGRNCRFLQGEGTDPNTTTRIRGALAAKSGCVEWILNYRADGTQFWNLLFLSPVFTDDGTLLHYFGNQRDISEGPPASLPDYALGRADMPAVGEREFHALLLGLLNEHRPEDESARRLDELVEAARQLDRLTTGLEPAPWRMS